MYMKSNSFDPQFGDQGARETHKSIQRKHVPLTIVVARLDVKWKTAFRKIYRKLELG